jgi:ubiquinone/menaquinone biosynthesis C-methylase UbiE
MMSSEQFLQMLAPAAGEKILDIGAGKGMVADRVLKASKGGAEVYAVEPNGKRVASMKRDFPAIKSSVAGAESLPFPDSYFDKVYTTMALHHFSDLDRALREIVRVLKQGGSLVILEIEPNSGVGRFFRFFGRVTGEHMGLMTEDQLVARVGSADGLTAAGSASQGSRYLVRATRA